MVSKLTMLITSHLPEIIKLIRNNAVVEINSPTGTGKSIGIPTAIASTKTRVFVSVPTRTSAVSLCNYQRKLQKK